MKLNTKFMLVTGVTTFLILTCVLLAALSYLTGTLNKIQQDASEYAVKDMQFRAKSNLRRFGDILSATHARASTFFTSKNLPKEEMLSILTTRFEHSSGTDAVVIGKYNLDEKADFLTGQFGMISLHNGKKRIRQISPAYMRSCGNISTANRKKRSLLLLRTANVGS